MIFFSNKSGQLGNRLFAFGHLIANAVANNLKIVNLSFDEYASYFESTRQDLLCRYPPVKGRVRSHWLRSKLFTLNKAVVKLLRIMSSYKSPLHTILVADVPEYKFTEENYFDLDAEGCQAVLKTKPIVFLFGRFFRDYKNFQKHQQVIRNFFVPAEPIQRKVDQFIQLHRHESDTLVGVHIRRGDYEQFADGKYFFSLQQYAEGIRNIQQNHPGNKIRFVLCSNEPIDETCFEGIDIVKGPNHLVEDMYTLAGCDYILGPPSTYSLWASFYGNRPLFQVRHWQGSIRLDDFVILPPKILFNFSFN